MSGYSARMVEHVIWDWNGTLLDDVDACVASLNDILRSCSLPTVSREEYADRFKFPVRDYYVELGFDFDRNDWDKVSEDYHVFYREHARDAALRDGTEGVLHKLESGGISMSILSACETVTLERMVSERKIRGFFRGLYGRSDYYAGSKLSAGRTALAAIDGDPGALLLIGDTDHDYEVAEELGCRCLLVCGGHQSDDRLRSCGCDVLASIEGIPDYAMREQ